MEKIKILTRSVKHPVLRYRETAPCIAFYRGALHLIFWRKTNVQTIMSPITHPTMLRLVAAIGAVNASDAFPFMINKGLIVDIYSSGEPATPHVVEQNLLELYWIRWLKRLKLFHMNFNKKMKFFE
ncbi:Uncharacterized protein C20orf72 like protein [Dufourea novaeangliae]|uniref:Uncharacterized protein C20orf72 like protein n=2 Tax=Dufourea novaeangliae TaxID=178035 RepID=A0A154PHK9_DUFNO|nr:Uncharacterized protein C20orf72 like protein [Dufourea novaeangliae]